MVYNPGYDRSERRPTIGAIRPASKPGGGAVGPAAMWQNDIGPAVECKRSDAPTLAPSMRIALEDLKLDRLIVVYPGDRRYTLHDRVEVVPLLELTDPDGDAAALVKKRRR
jgi:hypothetical protein